MFKLKLVIVLAMLGFALTSDKCELSSSNRFQMVLWSCVGVNDTVLANLNITINNLYGLNCDNCYITDFHLNPNSRSYFPLSNFQLKITNNRVPLKSINFGSNNTNDWSLILNNTSISNLGRVIVLSKVNTLLRLLIERNLITHITQADFSGMSDLRELSLKANLIRTIKDYTFIDLRSLTDLDLSLNYLSNLNENTFYNLKQLQILKINENHLKRIRVTFEFFETLPKFHQFFETNFIYNYSDRRLINLNYFPLRPVGDFVRSLTNIEMKLFDNLDLEKLTELHLNLLRIETLTPKCFSNFNSLEYLDLSRNYLTELKTDTFVGLFHLRVLRLEHNKLSHIDDNIFDKTTDLTYISLSHNLLKDVPSTLLYGLTYLIHIDLSHNLLSFNDQQASQLFQGQNILKILNLSYNQIDNIEVNFIRYLNELNQLLLDHNLLSDGQFHLKDMLRYMPKLTEINYQINRFSDEYLQNLNQICYHYKIESVRDISLPKLAVNGSDYEMIMKKVDIILSDNKMYINYLIFLTLSSVLLLVFVVSVCIFFPDKIKIFQLQSRTSS